MSYVKKIALAWFPENIGSTAFNLLIIYTAVLKAKTILNRAKQEK